MSEENTKKGGFWSSAFASSLVKTDKIRLGEKAWGYFIGPFGGLLASGIYTAILQNYFTDVLKLNLTFLSVLQLASTILIVIANLVVGQLIEHTHTLAGKARPWILLSALTISVASVLMFIVPFKNQIARMIWVAIGYNIYYSFAYPIYNTANSTLVAVSTRDSKARGELASLTNVAGLGVMGAGSMVFPVLVSFALKENQGLWFLAFLAIGLFTALTVFLQYKFTRERVTEEVEAGADVREGAKQKTVSLKEQLHAVTAEKTWWIIIVFYLVFQWSGAIKNGSMTFFCKWVLDNTFFGSADAWGASQSLLGILGAIPMAIAVLLVVPLSNRIGKRKLTFYGQIVGVAGGVIAYAGNGQIIPVAIGIAMKCLGSSPACYLILAMLADEIDHIEYKSGIRTDGLTMSIYSSIMVAATPVMNSVFSAILDAVGYNQNADITLGRSAQTAAVNSAINFSYIGVETIAYAICAVMILFWTVEKDLPKEQAELKTRNEKKNA